MLPPSSHISGLKYEWEDGLSAFDTLISELSPQMQTIMVKGITNPTSSTSEEIRCNRKNSLSDHSARAPYKQ